ncbi:hypothetical protein ACL6C3_16420 [Capilliphycus salinus ALCB114379]
MSEKERGWGWRSRSSILVEKYGGSIPVHSILGEGTKFIIACSQQI